MRATDLHRLAKIRNAISGTSTEPVTNAAAAAPDPGFSRHPLFLALLGFVLTSILGGYLTYWFNYQNQQYGLEASTRNNAIEAVTDLSNIVNERRERAALVISSIRRSASEEETNARKLAYDESYIRWNAKVPGDLLRIRAGLGVSYRSSYERYIDGLTNFNILLYGTDAYKLLHGQQISPQPGLFSAMDDCLTRAFDIYKPAKPESAITAQKVVSDCKFRKMYSDSIACFSTISESLYSGVNHVDGVPTIPISDEQVVEACKPP